MPRNSMFARWLLTALLLAGLFFGAAGGARAGENAAVWLTPTADFANDNSLKDKAALAPGDNDLSLEMSVSSSDQFPNIGDTVTFTIKVKNIIGTTTVTGVTVKDVLPAGLTYKSDDGGGTYDENTGIWSVGSIAAGVTAQLKLNATSTQTGPIDNTAEIWSADQADPDSTPGNCNVVLEDDCDTETINPKIADLSILKTVNDAAPNKGDNIDFTIAVTNAGPDDAENVTVKDLLPAGLTYVSDDGGGSYNPATGIWAVGTLLSSGVGSSDSIIITAHVDTVGVKTNAAEVWTNDQYDPDSTPGNGLAEDDYSSVSVTPKSADLSLTKTISNSAPSAGASVKFTVTVTNAGPDSATSVSVKDLLDSADYQYLSYSSSVGAYDDITGIWTVGPLANGASESIEINATTLVNGVATNCAEVWTSAEFDPDSTPGDGSTTSDDDDCAPTADLSITQTASPSTVTVGSNAVFTITVSNDGPGKASNVSVKDALPAGLAYVSDTGAGAYNSGTGVWTIGILNNGASKTLSITAEAQSDGILTNWAEVWTSKQMDIDSTPGDGSTAGDDDASASVTASFPTLTVLINEVAWAGASSTYSSDEWIELYNPTGAAIDLTGWTLKTPSNDPSINLSGSIPAGGYLLLEEGDDSTVSDIAADFIYSGTLSNSGELLALYDASNTIVDTADGSAGWPAGSSSTYGSMERNGVVPDGPAAWLTNDGSPRNGKNAGGGDIWGTPRQANSPPPPPTATPTATATRTRTPTGTLPPSAVPFKTVVISEVAWAGTNSSSSDEWIELFNMTTQPVDITGWRLVSYRYNGSSFSLNLNVSLSGVIPPRSSSNQNDGSGYFLLETRELAVSDIPADQIYSGSLYNSGEILLLCSAYNVYVAKNCTINVKNQLVDFVNATLNTNGSIKSWPAGSSSIYGSMERKDTRSDEPTAYFTHTGATPRNGHDANGNNIKGTPKRPNWAFTVTATPRATVTPTRTPTPRPAVAPILVINEVLPRAGTDWNLDGKVDVYDEFIEVINAGTVNVNLSAYKLDDAKDSGSPPFSLPSQNLAPGEKALFYASQTGIRLEDSGDTVRLLKTSNNSEADAVTYPVVKAVDFSICRYTDGYGSWIFGCHPTPGRPNSLSSDNPSAGPSASACLMPDSTPLEFVLAECGGPGTGIWNPSYWNSFPGEGNEIWQTDERDKWLVVYE